MKHPFAATLAALVCLAPRVTLADGGDAAVFYRAGERAFEARSYREAAKAFDAAYREDPRAASIFNAALSWQLASEPVLAADEYTIAIASTDLAPELATQARESLAKLEAHLTTVHVIGPAGAKVSVAQVKDRPVPTTFHVPPGPYGVFVTYADGTREVRTLAATDGGVVNMDVAPTPIPPKPPPKTLPLPVEDTHRETVFRPSPRALVGLFGRASVPVGVTLVASSAVLVGTAAGLGTAALGALDDFKRSGYTSQDAHDRTTALQAWTNAAWVGAALTGVLGMVTLVTLHKQKTSIAIGPASVLVRGTF